MSNVIPFPTREKLQEEADNLLIDIILDLSLGVFQRIDLIAEGLDMHMAYTDSTEKDMMLIHEAIKACLFRMTGKEHMLQSTADTINLADIKEIRFETHYSDEE